MDLRNCYKICEVARRVSCRPAVPLLFGARSTGHYHVNRSWVQIPKIGDFIELFWGVSGECEFLIDDRPQILHQDEVVFLFPGDRHLQRSLCDNTEFYWLTLDGDYCCELLEAYRLPRHPIQAGRCPEESFRRLYEEIYDLSLASQYQAGITTLSIFHQALIFPYLDPQSNQLVEKFRRLVQQHYRDPKCNLEFLIDQLGVHRCTLFRAFKAGTGQAPTEYLTTFRIREAMELLGGTNLPIHEIAKRCGYNDVNYFGKAFRRWSGKSPREFRTLA